MDYADNVNYDKSRWSTCSVEDFTVLMNKNKTCMQVSYSAPDKGLATIKEAKTGYTHIYQYHTFFLLKMEY